MLVSLLSGGRCHPRLSDVKRWGGVTPKRVRKAAKSAIGYETASLLRWQSEMFFCLLYNNGANFWFFLITKHLTTQIRENANEKVFSVLVLMCLWDLSLSISARRKIIKQCSSFNFKTCLQEITILDKIRIFLMIFQSKPKKYFILRLTISEVSVERSAATSWRGDPTQLWRSTPADQIVAVSWSDITLAEGWCVKKKKVRYFVRRFSPARDYDSNVLVLTRYVLT